MTPSSTTTSSLLGAAALVLLVPDASAQGSWRELIGPSVPGLFADYAASATDPISGVEFIDFLTSSDGYEWDGCSLVTRSGDSSPLVLPGDLTNDPITGNVVALGIESYGTTSSFVVSELTAAGWIDRDTSATLDRFGHTATLYPEARSVVIFGGLGAVSSTIVGDQATWDGTSLSAAATLPGAPSPRLFHAASYDPVRGSVIVHGGTDGLSTFSRTFELTFTPAGGFVWTQLAGVGPALQSHTMYFDATLGVHVATGGTDASGQNTTVFELSVDDTGATWTAVDQIANALTTQGASFRDPVSARRTVVGSDASTNEVSVQFGLEDTVLLGSPLFTEVAGCPAAGATDPAEIVAPGQCASIGTTLLLSTINVTDGSPLAISSSFALDPAAVPCGAQLASPIPFFNGIAGGAPASFAIPNSPGLVGTQVFLQGAVFDLVDGLVLTSTTGFQIGL